MFQPFKLIVIMMMIACVMPLMMAVVAKVLGGFSKADNQHPRDFLSQLTGKSARANSAQQNCFEILPVFLSSVLIALYAVIPTYFILSLTVAFTIFRLGYVIAYIYNTDSLRSILWTLSFMCCICLYLLTIWFY